MVQPCGLAAVAGEGEAQSDQVLTCMYARLSLPLHEQPDLLMAISIVESIHMIGDAMRRAQRCFDCRQSFRR